MTEPATITCPVCDAPNMTRSLFCAECGTPLNPSAEDSTYTRPGATVADSQATAVIPSSRSWSNPPEAPMPRNASTSTTVAPAAGLSPADPNPYIYSPLQPAESRRGLWLGLIALILMLIILGMWIWGGVLAADTRSSVRDLFG